MRRDIQWEANMSDNVTSSARHDKSLDIPTGKATFKCPPCVFMADAAITKRLIISGLTPAITVDDMRRRLGSFGSVKAIDGFGLVDGLGQPRKFGYVTLETTPSRLGKCAFSFDYLKKTFFEFLIYRMFYSFSRHECTQRICLERHKIASW